MEAMDMYKQRGINRMRTIFPIPVILKDRKNKFLRNLEQDGTSDRINQAVTELTANS
jgi:hypothetical protein